MYIKEKRGQVTIFIIIAILIVALAVLIYLLIPKAETTAVFDEKNPNAFIQFCLEDKIEDIVEKVSLQGGSLAPEHYFTYNDIPIEYLCYTNENYEACIIQNPLLKQHVESEIENGIKQDVVDCFNALKENYEGKNYNVGMNTGKTTLELLPNRIVVNMGYSMSVSKDQTDRYTDFSVILNNNLYELISIANSILEEEVIGEKPNGADVREYMALYHHLEVNKNVRDEERIYVLTDKPTEAKFQFAVRSWIAPPGY